MKKYYGTLKALIKAEPQFKPRFQLLECPAFIVNAFQAKPAIESKKTKILWENSPAKTAESSEIKTLIYHPKYQEA